MKTGKEKKKRVEFQGNSCIKLNHFYLHDNWYSADLLRSIIRLQNAERCTVYRSHHNNQQHV